jgi:hypothetical protein
LCVALVAQRQCAIEEMLSRFGGNFDQVRDAEFLQGGARLPNAREIFAENARAYLADGGHGLARAMVDDINLVEAFVRFAAAKRGEVWEVHAQMGNRKEGMSKLE